MKGLLCCCLHWLVVMCKDSRFRKQLLFLNLKSIAFKILVSLLTPNAVYSIHDMIYLSEAQQKDNIKSYMPDCVGRKQINKKQNFIMTKKNCFYSKSHWGRKDFKTSWRPGLTWKTSLSPQRSCSCFSSIWVQFYKYFLDNHQQHDLLEALEEIGKTNSQQT